MSRELLSVANNVTYANTITKALNISACRHGRFDGNRLTSFCMVKRHSLRLCCLCRMTVTRRVAQVLPQYFLPHRLMPWQVPGTCQYCEIGHCVPDQVDNSPQLVSCQLLLAAGKQHVEPKRQAFTFRTSRRDRNQGQIVEKFGLRSPTKIPEF